MWLMTTSGFYSLVKHKTKQVWILRARERRDLVNAQGLIHVSCRSKIVETPRSDYRWRMFISASGRGQLLVNLGALVDYPNFKNEVEHFSDQRKKIASYHRVWGVMADALGAYGQDWRLPWRGE